MSLSIPFSVWTITTSGTIKNEHFQIHITSQYLASMHVKTCITCWTSMNTSMDSCLVVLDSSISCCRVSYVTAVSGSKPGRSHRCYHFPIWNKLHNHYAWFQHMSLHAHAKCRYLISNMKPWGQKVIWQTSRLEPWDEGKTTYIKTLRKWD